jgi:hypothetical protein
VTTKTKAQLLQEIRSLRKENEQLRKAMSRASRRADHLEMWNTIYQRELIDWQQMMAQRFQQ